MAGGSGQFDSNVAAGMKNYGGNCGRDSSFCGCTLLGPSASGIPTIHGNEKLCSSALLLCDVKN
jgi:hypothetical protein